MNIKNIKYKFYNFVLVIILIFTIQNSVFANEGPGGDTFYIPEYMFTTTNEYDEYCENMYNHGYMDENSEWIPEAKSYIENPSQESYEILYEKGKETVKKRIAYGIMEPEDSAYITYEERQKILEDKKNGVYVNPYEKDYENTIDEDVDENISSSDEEDYGDEFNNEIKENNTQNENENNINQENINKRSILSKIIVAIGIIIILLIGIYIYKKQEL